MWTNGIPKELVKYLPPGITNEAMVVYGHVLMRLKIEEHWTSNGLTQ
jgi:hypothetical protein